MKWVAQMPEALQTPVRRSKAYRRGPRLAATWEKVLNEANAAAAQMNAASVTSR